MTDQRRGTTLSPRSSGRRFSNVARARDALLLAAVLATTARAQDPPPLTVPDSMRTMICKKVCDVVSGIVFDSLADAPLGGAFVVAMPSGVSTTADSLGRFVIASDGRVQQLTVYHGVLDELGLGALTATRPSGAAEWKRVRIATPSLPTIWARLCPTKSPTRLRGVIIAGTARLTDNSTRLSGAKIMVQWTTPPAERASDILTSAETLTDSTGSFVICGVADFVEPSLVALSTEAQSGVVTLPSDSRPLRRVDLVMAPTGAAPTIVRGRVVNEWNAPLPDIRVSIDGREGEVVTGPDGAFRLVDAPLGSRMLAVRALGFPPVLQVVHVVEGDMEALRVPITRTYTLGTINLSPTDTVRRDRVEFERRKRTGIGYFIDSTTLQRAPDLRTALRTAPGISITDPPSRAKVQQSQANRATLPDGAPASSRIEFEMRGRGACRLNVFLDGELDPANTPLFTNKAFFAAIEVYAQANDIPAGIVVSNLRQTNFTGGCGAVFFWTRYGLRP